uniref:Ataxin 7 n=1 Tax=Oncorhynchus kisutch TaxID=8019 RepID=A0A8C7I4P9_ONCKI
MSERADDDVRGEQRRAARQLKQQQIQRGEGSTAMATVAERRSLPSPEMMLGQSWSNWVDAAIPKGNDGAESEESLKEFGKNREAMRLCRDERRHSSAIMPPSTSAPSSACSLSWSRGSGAGAGGVSGGAMGRSSSGTSALSNSKILKPAKEKLPGIQQRPHFPPFRELNDKILTPAVKVEKMRLKVDVWAKLVQAPLAATTSSSSSSTVSSSSPLKPGLNCPSIPKAPLLAPGQIPNGKGHISLSALDKKQDNSASNRQHLHKRLSEREFNPDIHCGVLDMTARKPCTRSLTCKTHSLSQRRAVLGRRKRFDTLLTEHKSKARERELQHTHPQQTPPLRDPHPSPSRLAPHHDAHQVAQGNGAADAATKPLVLGKPKPQNPGLPRLNSSISQGGGGFLEDPSLVHESPHHSTPTPDGVSCLSSDEGENEEREEGTDKLDCHYSGYQPRPAAYCTFGSRLFGTSCYSFDRRWDRMRCALTAMMDKHVNTQMWKKIPLALENSSSAPAHRTSTNSLSSSHGSTPASGFLSPSAPPPPPYTQSYDSKSVLSYGTTLNARASQGTADHPAYSATQARQVSSSPQMPSAHSSVTTLASGRPLKSRSSGKSFRPRESSSTAAITNSTSGGSTSLSSGKKKKNSSLTLSHATTYSSESSSNPTSSSTSSKKNCTVNSGSSGSTSHHAPLVPSSHSGVHSVGLNCGPNARTNSLSLKAEPSGPAGVSGPGVRGPPSGSPAESIKRMSVVMNSSDSTLSLGPFVHQASEHHSRFSHAHTDGRLEGKKRKGSPAASSVNSGGGPGRPKVAKSPAINNIHGKHGRTIPGGPGLPNNSLIHQVGWTPTASHTGC